MSEEAYLAFEREASERHEYVNGEVYAMAGGSMAHARVAANTIVALQLRLRGSGCMPTTSDQRVFVPGTGLYTYPDVSVVCGEPERHPKDKETLTNPTLLVEVLSPTTEGYDRGAKFVHYRSIPSLRAYVLISPEARTVEAFERRPDGAWSIPDPAGPGQSLRLSTFDLELVADELFEDLDRYLPPPPPPDAAG
ncbi:MAG: Uma2 family endonuclease [Myxococcales bacterium]|nr:Uma2 family endonuclease [Myxococcales bacterium]MCB9646276.1 Uma2 family endonuclease [Deltaproteobacteria bacterium]